MYMSTITVHVPGQFGELWLFRVEERKVQPDTGNDVSLGVFGQTRRMPVLSYNIIHVY